VSGEDLNRFPPRETMPEDGQWRIVGRDNGYRVALECGGDCGIRIVNSTDDIVWEGARHHAQRLAGLLNRAATIKVGDG
jgi:hypothetical protein